MKILHISDTHLGYTAYRKVTDEGMNQREIDVYNAFIQIIDYVIKNKPDLILHAGDLFDSVRPTNRAISIAIQQLIRLTKSDIPMVIIAGNHETPRLKETGHIFTIFEHLNNIYPVYNNKYEQLSYEIKNKKITIHAIPHCHTKKDFSESFKKIKKNKSSDFDILLTHGAVSDLKEFRMNEFNELIIPISKITALLESFHESK